MVDKINRASNWDHIEWGEISSFLYQGNAWLCRRVRVTAIRSRTKVPPFIEARLMAKYQITSSSNTENTTDIKYLPIRTFVQHTFNFATKITENFRSRVVCYCVFLGHPLFALKTCMQLRQYIFIFPVQGPIPSSLSRTILGIYPIKIKQYFKKRLGVGWRLWTWEVP